MGRTVSGRRGRVRAMSVPGRRRIVELEPWDREDPELLGAAVIEFGDDRSGHFAFIAADGWMDWRETTRAGRAGGLTAQDCPAAAKMLIARRTVPKRSNGSSVG